MKYPLRLVIVLTMLSVQQSQLQARQEEEVPSLELLEFLGEWETENGEWFDPDEFNDEDFGNLLILTEEENE